MKYVVCAVRDRATDCYGRPFCVAHMGDAIRSFVDEINSTDERNALARHPEDYDLYHLGHYDDSSGTFECGVPHQIAIGKDSVRIKG